MRQNHWIVATALGAALVANAPIDAAAKPTAVISAVVDGHKVKFKNQHVEGGIAQGSGLSIDGGTHSYSRPSKFLPAKVLSLLCANGPSAGGTFPAAGQACQITYQTSKPTLGEPRRAGRTVKLWLTPVGATVTFTSFGSSRVQGTFEGTLDDVDGGSGSITVTNGTFSIPRTWFP